MTHLDHLLETFPIINRAAILDIGAGRGKFMIDAVKSGLDIKGIEFKKENIDIAKSRAMDEGVEINLIQGRGEELPFKDGSFGLMWLYKIARLFMLDSFHLKLIKK